MIHFLAPIWFLSAAAVAIPILIHLWNNRKGKTLLVGSTAFFEKAAEEKSWQRKLTDPLLLLLRCLLLLLLSALLAQPFFPAAGTASGKNGWVLVPANHFSQAYKKFQQPIDSLLKNGYELRYFEPGFALTTTEAAIRDSSRLGTNENTSYWALAEAAQQAVADSMPLYIFTDNRLSNFRGARPARARKLHWNTFSITGDSSGEALHTKTNPVDGALSVVVVTDGNSNDGDYIRAALAAIAEFEKRKIDISQIAGEDKTVPSADWIFWLKSNKPTSRLQCRNLLIYETGEPETVSTWISTGDNIQMAEEQTGLYRIAGNQLETDSAQIIWKDGFGRGLLTAEKTGDQNHFHFYSHFDPAWNGLVWSSEFPSVLKSLLEFEKIESDHNLPDLRTIDPLQVNLEPGKAVFAGLIQPGNQPVNSAATLLWVLVFLVFMLERVISFIRQNKGEHGQ